jgi:hypothetical protein
MMKMPEQIAQFSAVMQIWAAGFSAVLAVLTDIADAGKALAGAASQRPEHA